MKPVIDMELTLMGKYLSDTLFCNVIKNYWGTTYIDGVEVMKAKFTLYPKPSTLAYKKITGILRLKDKVEQNNFQDIAEYYLKFNPIKLSSTNYNDLMLVGKLNDYILTGSYSTAWLNINDDTDPAKFNSMTEQQLKNYVINNYPTLVDQLVVGAGNTLSENTISKFVLLDLGQCLDIKIDKINVTPVKHTTTSLVRFKEVTSVYYTSAIAVQISYKRINPITTTSNIFVGIKREQSEAVKRALYDISTSTSNRGVDVVYTQPSRLLTDDIWYKGYLRASVLNTRAMKRATVSKLLGECIDTGYTQIKKKKKWWQKALAPVLFIVAVFLAPWSGGTSLGAFAAYWAAVAVAFTVLSFAMAKWGDTVSAEYMGKYAKVSGYISAVTGIASFFQSIARNIATQGIKEYVMGSVRNMVQSITNSISSVQSGSIISEFGTYVSENFMQILNKSVSIGSKVANFWMEKRAEKQAKILTSNGAILDKQSEELAKFTDKEYNIGLEDLKLYTKPLTVDNIQYEVDYLYEPSKYNICRPSFITPSLNIRSTKVGK